MAKESTPIERLTEASTKRQTGLVCVQTNDLLSLGNNEAANGLRTDAAAKLESIRKAAPKAKPDEIAESQAADCSYVDSATLRAALAVEKAPKDKTQDKQPTA